MSKCIFKIFYELEDDFKQKFKTFREASERNLGLTLKIEELIA